MKVKKVGFRLVRNFRQEDFLNLKNEIERFRRRFTYGTRASIDRTGSILFIDWTGAFVDGAGRFVAGGASLIDRTTSGAKSFGVFLLYLWLRLDDSFLGRIGGSVSTTPGGTRGGRRRGVVVAAGSGSSAVACVIVIQCQCASNVT